LYQIYSSTLSGKSKQQQPTQAKSGSYKQEIQLATWMDSYHRYAVGATVTGNAQYVDLINHMHTSVQAGDQIHNKDKRISTQAGTVMYDRIVRKEWDRLMSQGEPVDMTRDSQTVNDEAVKQALLLAPYQSWGSGQRVTDDALPTKPWVKPNANKFWKSAQANYQKGKGGKGQGKGQKGKGKGKKGTEGWPKPKPYKGGKKNKGE
jgi:hypothetical protein